MSVVQKDFTFTSSVGDCKIHAISWKPNKGKVKAVFQIAHGMAEHIERYDDFAKFMAENGYAVYANDHIGHGQSINKEYIPGYFGMNNEAANTFIEDCKLLTDIAKEENPGKPVVLFGHSMGSFIARKYTAKYGDGLTAAIYCGTAGPNPAVDIAIALDKFFCKVVGMKKEGVVIDKLAFGAYNNKTEKRTSYDWLSRDNKVVDKYIADDMCGFLFTNRGYYDLLTLLKSISSNEWAASVPAALPIFMIAGAMDPVGTYGKGVKTIYKKLLKTGHKVDLKLYDGARHEILNELENAGTYADVLSWTDSKIGAGKLKAKKKCKLCSLLCK